MSGFLQRLGARAVGRTGIAPRAQSLFEPPSSAAPEPLPVMPASMPLRMEHDAAQAREQAPVSTTPRTPVAPPVRERVGPSAITPSETREAARSDLTQTSRFGRETLPARAEQPEIHKRATIGPLQQATGEPSVPMQPVAGARTIARELSSVPALVAMQPLPVVVPRTGSAATAPLAQAEPRSVEPVRVTIGRVEVRAMLAPQPGRASTRTASPSLSLDDYLRNRGRA